MTEEEKDFEEIRDGLNIMSGAVDEALILELSYGPYVLCPQPLFAHYVNKANSKQPISKKIDTDEKK